jgi:23S rRNA pseudouridine2457 synthase
MARTLKFNKPFGVLSQFTDIQGRQTLSNFISVPGVYAAGRLDYNSEGLMILTSSGRLIQRLTDPRFAHQKTYVVQLEGLITVDALQRLNQEILLPGVQTHLAQAEEIPAPDLPVRQVRSYHPHSWIKITLSEGKKHQVRRMTARVGFPALRLVRVAIGPISLGALAPGQWSDLTRQELELLDRVIGPA